MLHVVRQKDILRTIELHAVSHCEAITKFERGRMDDVLGNAEVQLLVVVRFVREHLALNPNRGRGDLDVFQVVFNLIDLHVLPLEVEELV